MATHVAPPTYVGFTSLTNFVVDAESGGVDPSASGFGFSVRHRSWI